MVRCNQNHLKLNYLFTCQDDNLIDRQFSKFQQAFNQELIKSLEIYPFICLANNVDTRWGLEKFC